MVERSLEVHSSLSSSAAMDSPHACTTPARSGPTHRAGGSMHGIPWSEHGAWHDDAIDWFLSIKPTIATLARASEAVLIVPKPFA